VAPIAPEQLVKIRKHRGASWQRLSTLVANTNARMTSVNVQFPLLRSTAATTVPTLMMKRKSNSSVIVSIAHARWTDNRGCRGVEGLPRIVSTPPRRLLFVFVYETKGKHFPMAVGLGLIPQ
jgi:hypothetical protein